MIGAIDKERDDVEGEDAREEMEYTIVPKWQARDVNTSIVASRGTLHGTRCRKLRNVDITTHASPMAAPNTSDLPTAVNGHIRWKVNVKAH